MRDVILELHCNGITDPIRVKEVMHSPEAAVNLLTSSKITQKGYSVTFDKNIARVLDSNKELVVTARPLNGIYKVKTEEH